MFTRVLTILEGYAHCFKVFEQASSTSSSSMLPDEKNHATISTFLFTEHFKRRNNIKFDVPYLSYITSSYLYE